MCDIKIDDSSIITKILHRGGVLIMSIVIFEVLGSADIFTLNFFTH